MKSVHIYLHGGRTQGKSASRDATSTPIPMVEMRNKYNAAVAAKNTSEAARLKDLLLKMHGVRVGDAGPSFARADIEREEADLKKQIAEKKKLYDAAYAALSKVAKGKPGYEEAFKAFTQTGQDMRMAESQYTRVNARRLHMKDASSDVRIVENKLLGGWFVVRGSSDTPISGKFDSKEAAQSWLAQRSSNKEGRQWK